MNPKGILEGVAPRERARGVAAGGTAISHQATDSNERPAGCWKPILRLVLAYSDAEALSAAEPHVAAITQRLQPHFTFSSAWLSFACLAHPAMLEHAVRAALEADMILFAVHLTEDMPAPVGVWMDLWLARRDPRNGAVVGLLTTPQAAGNSPPIVEPYLRKVAGVGGLDFFLNEYPGLGPAQAGHAREVSSASPGRYPSAGKSV